MAITDDNGQLVIRFTHTPVLVGKLEHWQYDTFVARWSDREATSRRVRDVHAGPRRHVASVKMLPASPDVDFSFDFQDLDLKPVKGK